MNTNNQQIDSNMKKILTKNIKESPFSFQNNVMMSSLIQIFTEQGTNFYAFILSHPQISSISKEAIVDLEKLNNNITSYEINVIYFQSF